MKQQSSASTKILFTTTSYLPAIGGAQLHTHQIVKRLAIHHPVQVITQWTKHRTDWLLGTTLKAPTLPQSYTFENVPAQQITLTPAERWRVLPYVVSYYVLKPRAIRQISAILAAKIRPLATNCSLIQNSRIGREPLSFASWQVAQELDIPFILVPYHHPRWQGWNYREYHTLYRQADGIIALTHSEKETLAQLGVKEERIFVTGNGPNLADKAQPEQFRASLNLPPDVPLILFLGQKYRYKGFESLADAAKIVWQKHPEARFLFIGPRTTLSQKFFKKQADPRLTEWGAVDLQQKTDALAACTLLCLPSTQESFGGVYTEAWSFAKPVIGANIPAVREVIDDGQNGYLVEQTPTDIAEKISYLLENPTFAAQLGQAGKAKTQAQFSWERLAQKTEEVYTTVLAGI